MLKELVDISKFAGMREDLVQAGGGNSSIKLDNQRMAIKSSGIQMADITDDTGYSIVDYPMIKKYMDILLEGIPTCTEKELLDKAVIEGKRPSIETFLHAITGRVTLHTHPISVNILTARQGGMEKLKQLFPDSLLVDYATPGLELAKRYYRTYTGELAYGKKDFSITFLKNHGLIISGESSKEVIQCTEYVNRIIENEVGLNNSAYRKAYELYDSFRKLEVSEDNIVVKVENKKILDLYSSLGSHMWAYQICPDCVVFCGRKAFSYSADNWQEELKEHIDCYGIPVIIQYGSDLFIYAESVKKAKEIESVLGFSAEVVRHNTGYNMDLLNETEQAFLLGWDVEQYRRTMK